MKPSSAARANLGPMTDDAATGRMRGVFVLADISGYTAFL